MCLIARLSWLTSIGWNIWSITCAKIAASDAKSGRVWVIHRNSWRFDLHYSYVQRLLSGWIFWTYSQWCIVRDSSELVIMVTAAKIRLSFVRRFASNIFSAIRVWFSNSVLPMLVVSSTFVAAKWRNVDYTCFITVIDHMLYLKRLSRTFDALRMYHSSNHLSWPKRITDEVSRLNVYLWAETMV